jgi:sugar lactone lactonase YvrE
MPHISSMRFFAALIVLASVAGRSAAHPPSGIAIDREGTVYFVDGARGVWRVDDNGKLTLINESAMHFLAIDHDGAFADAEEQFGEWFGRLTPRGATPTLISCSDFPCTIGADGNLYFAKMHGLEIMRRTPEGAESALVSRKDFNVDADSPVGVNGIAAGRDGTIYTVSLDSLNRTVGTGEHFLYAISASGRVRAVARNFVTDKLPEAKQHPEVRPEYCRGLAVDDEYVYVAVTGNRCVMKISFDGQAKVILTCEPPWTPTGLAVRRGEVFVLEYDDETPTEGRNWPLRVRKVDGKGKVTNLAEVIRSN